MDIQFDNFEFVLRQPRFLTSFKDTNWDNFRRDLDNYTSIIMPPENRNLHNMEIDQLIDEFTLTVNTVTNSHSKKIELKNKKIYISEKIKKFFKLSIDGKRR